MLRATERVFVSQSALSLQMKRPEETVQASLFQREGRRLALTPAGQTLLVYAREILAKNDRAVSALIGDTLAGPARVGLVQDFAETPQPGVPARFAHLNPDAQLQVRVGGSPALLEELEADRLDVVLCMGAADDRAAIRVAPMAWLGDGDLAARAAEGWPYRVVLETPSLSVLRAAVDSGLAATCRTRMFSNRTLGGEVAAALPALPHVAYARLIRASPHPTIQRLRELMNAAVLDLQPEGPPHRLRA